MTVNTNTRWALSAMIDLARAGEDETVNVATIAHRHEIPETALAKVFQRLVWAGLVVGTRGAHGGYTLARDPNERFQDAGQMQRGLERFLRERPPVTARDLARFLELLFDRSEREEGGEERHAQDGAGDQAPDPMSLDSLLKRFGIDE